MFVIASTILNFMDQQADILVSDTSGAAGYGIPVKLPLATVWAGKAAFVDAVRAALVSDGVPGADTATIELDGVRPPAPSEVKALSLEIDRAAGEARERYITVVPGQAETYTAKALEAERYIAAGAPTDLTQYPLIQAEVNAFGYPDGAAAANAILAKRDLWMQKGAQIEELRLKYKNLISKATTIQEAARLRQQALQALAAV